MLKEFKFSKLFCTVLVSLLLANCDNNDKSISVAPEGTSSVATPTVPTPPVETSTVPDPLPTNWETYGYKNSSIMSSIVPKTYNPDQNAQGFILPFVDNGTVTQKPNYPFDVDTVLSPQVPVKGESYPGRNGTFIELIAGPDFPNQLQNALITASPGTIILLPEGTFNMPSEISVSVPNITIAGRGMLKTILDFSQQLGGQGILGTGNAIKIQDLTVQNTTGDGIKIEGADGVHLQRVRVMWTNGSGPENGAYGFYPVFSKNVIIEGCVSIGASDAGVYVGQTDNAIVRNNIVEYNVAGVEIENVDNSEVYNNWVAYNNTGIFIFDAPYIKGNTGKNRSYKNVVYKNNNINYGGGLVGELPPGGGMLILAIDDVEIFDNLIRDHLSFSIGIISTAITGLAKYDPNEAADDLFPERINIHDNKLENFKRIYATFDSDFSLFANIFSLFNIPDILYDGAAENFKAQPLTLCQDNNQNQFFQPVETGNLNLGTFYADLGFIATYLPLGLIRNQEKLNCRLDSLAPITVDASKPIPDEYNNPFVTGSIEELCELAKVEEGEVNWSALAVNCPKLSQYNLFSDLADPRSTPNGNGQEYDLTTPLFTDYSQKHRIIYVPPNQKAVYNDTQEFEFPVGSFIAKNFYTQDDSKLIETRLLIKRNEGWVGLPYTWNEDNTEAMLTLSGGFATVTVNDGETTKETQYQIPNANQCIICHGQDRGQVGINAQAIRETVPIGPKAKWLNKDYDYGDDVENQLIHIAKAGILQGLDLRDKDNYPRQPIWNDASDGSVAERARSYLDINCAHCHNEKGFAHSTHVFFESDSPVSDLGVCKSPVAAGPGTGGFKFDIVPGQAENSIMSYRIHSEIPGARMPELARSVEHKQGALLIDEWINLMSGEPCLTPE